jgi:hypothetical protein
MPGFLSNQAFVLGLIALALGGLALARLSFHPARRAGSKKQTHNHAA